MKKEIDYYHIAYHLHENPLEGYSYEDLLEISSVSREEVPFNHLKMRELAVQMLVDKHAYPPLSENPLTAGAVLCLIGTSVFKVKDLRTRLEAFGIDYSAKINEHTTHVLIGANPKNKKGLEQYKVTLLTDQLLQAELDRLEQPYLQEQGASTTAHLSDLLMSLEEDNVLLAIELIKGGGFPKELIPQAFWAMKSSSNKTIYKELKEILDKYLSAAGKKAIRKTLQIDLYTTEFELTKKLHEFCRRAPDLDAMEIAWQLFKYHKKGMQYIWRHSKDSALRKKVIEGLIEEDTLDISDKGISTLPKEIEEYPQITKVLLVGNELGSIPIVLYKLPKLKHLDLSKNYRLQNLSPRMAEMKSLRSLNLYGPVQYWNMPVMIKLTQLEELILRENRYYRGPYGAIVIKKNLPQCKVTVLP